MGSAASLAKLSSSVSKFQLCPEISVLWQVQGKIADFLFLFIFFFFFGKDKSDNFQALYMRELKLEVLTRI